ncbi:hypothetical protein [Phocicoccus pinnipedialis]|uniref:hypothetical protein n=2 Tax=Phocicoccus pinnipedialis TaxID=110845 RepID=UPI001AE5A82F|nr:hypothetical protein [Jeotgalicoccus pinnipedialis]MBP1940272.1 hypothetical protein [Jeotgalicoccus pinnipedialis]
MEYINHILKIFEIIYVNFNMPMVILIFILVFRENIKSFIDRVINIDYKGYSISLLDGFSSDLRYAIKEVSEESNRKLKNNSKLGQLGSSGAGGGGPPIGAGGVPLGVEELPFNSSTLNNNAVIQNSIDNKGVIETVIRLYEIFKNKDSSDILIDKHNETLNFSKRKIGDFYMFVKNLNNNIDIKNNLVFEYRDLIFEVLKYQDLLLNEEQIDNSKIEND